MGMARYLSQLLNSSGIVNHSKMPTGSVLQVVNGTYSTQVTSTSATFADTGLTATITPKFSTSKILIFATINGVGKNAVNTIVGTQLVRNGSFVTYIDAYSTFNSAAANNSGSVSLNYLDSPASTSALTYKVQFQNQLAAGTVLVQAYNSITLSVSTITLMEIAG